MRTFAVLTLFLIACGTEDRLALDEPIVGHLAEFKSGKLPQSDAAGRPAITSVEYSTGALRPGTQAVPLLGRASGNAYSVGIQLLGQGSGYWTRPVGAEDLLTPGELTWELNFDVGAEVEPGVQKLGIVAFDEDGKPGPQNQLDVCVARDVPDNGNVCNPSREPPVVVAALRWNSDADLDLVVIAPDGERYSRSQFSRLDEEGNVLARLDGDGTSGCALDGRRGENFVWNEAIRGDWYVYANLFDACQKTSVEFELTIYVKVTNDDGTFSLVEQRSVGGQLLRAQSTPGSERPLYLTRVSFQ